MTDPASSPAQPNPGRRVADTEPTAAGGPARRAASGGSFAGSLGWTALGTLVPGLGLWRAGRKVIGGIMLGLFALALLALVFFALASNTMKFRLLAPLSNYNVLNGIAIALIVVAVLWVASIGFTHLMLRPTRPTMGQRIAGAVVVGALSFLVAAPMALGASYASTTAGLLQSSFDQSSATAPKVDTVDPWAKKKRLNILIMGGDSGTGRPISEGVRPDSNIVVSIDTTTGATSMFNLPRQTAKMPFPVDSPLHKYFPNGFYDGTNPLDQEYALNAIYNNIPHLVPKDILGNAKSLSTDAMKLAVGEALGLDIDYYVLVNMDGFKDIINAIGGVTVNVNDRVPIGGHNASGTKPEQKPTGWIEIGANQHLNGRLALWFSRGRYHTTDYKRMARQRCVINAVIQQIDPLTLLTKYQALVAAGSKTISTDIPSSLLLPLAELAQKVKGKSIRSVLLNQQVGFKTWDPDWPMVRTLVAKTLAEADTGATASPSASGSPSASTSASASSSPTTNSNDKSENLDDSCAYHPNK